MEYRLDLEAWERAYRRLGIISDAQAASALHLADSTLSRVRSGQTRPSNEFMAHVRHYWPGERFEELFYVAEVA